MKAHTPGPWNVERVKEFERQPLINPIHLIWCDGLLLARTCFAPSSEANARLIAAAPDMLAALRSVAQHADDEAGFMVLVRAAITKAEGMVLA